MEKGELQTYINEQRWDEAFETLAQELHTRLYERQSFDILTEFSVTERGIITLDYIQAQVNQGGFIQLIQNGYISLLVPLIEALQQLNIAPDMEKVLDDVLKVYVLNNDTLSKETSVQEFARLYEEFREFEILEKSFFEALPDTVKSLSIKALETK